jgi:hypothetical protein
LASLGFGGDRQRYNWKNHQKSTKKESWADLKGNSLVMIALILFIESIVAILKVDGDSSPTFLFIAAAS